jgi:hypothetical protein
MLQANTGGQFACNGHLTRIDWIFNRCDNSWAPGIYENVTCHKAWIEVQLYETPQTDETSSETSDSSTTTNAPPGGAAKGHTGITLTAHMS